MSADRYDVCPCCNGLRKELNIDFRELYGKIPESEYLTLIREKQEHIGQQTVETYYDYELHKNGIVTFNISAECEVCGMKWEYSNNADTERK